MADGTDDGSDAPGCECKVGRVINRWDLAGMNDELAERWRTGEASLRALEREFNVAVLRAAARAAGVTPLEGEAENLYRLLTDDDVTGGMRVRARRRLESEGLDVDRVRSDFVSHQTVHNHLTGCLGVERERQDRDPVATAEDRIRPLQTRLEAVASDALTGLGNDGHMTAGDLDVYVDVAVVCDDCGVRRELGAFLAAGGCDCEDPPDP